MDSSAACDQYCDDTVVDPQHLGHYTKLVKETMPTIAGIPPPCLWVCHYIVSPQKGSVAARDELKSLFCPENECN